MKTENTESTDARLPRAQIFYDAQCRLCRRFLARCGPPLTRRGFHFVPLQDAIASGRHPIADSEFYREMKLLRQDGRWLGGADAWIELGRAVWWLSPIAWLATLPGLHAVAVHAYRTLAAHRHCLGGRCVLDIPEPKPRQEARPAGAAVRTKRPLDGWLPLLMLPRVVLACRDAFAPWVFMWVLAFALLPLIYAWAALKGVDS